ncbi:MAG: cation:proton antiporter [Robiginitomaculum sp.]|nr:MAG: cation:proton antiporter [Robiginitomaculum sp.]
MSDLLHILDVIRPYFAGIILLSGGFIVLIGASGVLRLPDFYTRLHAAGVTDTLGALLVLLGLILLSGFTLLSGKLALVGLFLLLTSPTATHAVANAAHKAGLKPRLGTVQSQPPVDSSGDPS